MEYKKLLLKLGETGKDILESKIPFHDIKEILINVGCKTVIYYQNEHISIGNKIYSQKDIQNIFSVLCDYSVHSYNEEIKKGFITIDGGIRIGICGTAIYDEEKIVGIKDISSLNIRIPHEIFGVSDKIFHLHKNGGMLIIGPPCSGKTTLLRDLARKLSEEIKTVIVDERSEIAATVKGMPSFNVGKASVLNEFYKKDGIIISARAFSPQIIICDELGGKGDFESSVFAMKSGCNIIASMHAFDFGDFITKPGTYEIIKSGIFRNFIFLGRNCKIEKVMDLEEITV